LKSELFLLFFKAFSGVKCSPDRTGTSRLKSKENKFVIVFQGGYNISVFLEFSRTFFREFHFQVYMVCEQDLIPFRKSRLVGNIKNSKQRRSKVILPVFLRENSSFNIL